MEVNVEVRLSTSDKRWLCFRHAVLAAMAGEEVEMSVDDYSSEYYCGPTYCEMCFGQEDP